jgi:glycosyltransferase involved in cell wall biosynthesis
MPRVSVLTPVHNGEPHLPECIESVLRQTHRDWDYTIIDNCSRDSTPEIARDYAARDPRIRVVSNSRFVGVIENHNIAFSLVDPGADYCKIVQADDWLYPGCLEKFVDVAERHPSVVLAGAYRRDQDQIGLEGLPPERSFFPGREIGRALFLGDLRDVFGSPTSHFFRASAIRARRPFYNPLNMHADTEACFAVLEDGDFAFVHDVLTFTRRPGDTQTSRSHNRRSSFPGFLRILMGHGRRFLSEAEFNRCVERHLRSYYLVLARDLLKGHGGREYWRYHRDELRDLGHPLRLLRLLGALPLVPLEKLRNRGQRDRSRWPPPVDTSKERESGPFWLS